MDDMAASRGLVLEIYRLSKHFHLHNIIEIGHKRQNNDPAL
jgi:hypothetical protein